MTMASQHGFVQMLALDKCLRGWALAAQGQGEAGITQMHEGLAGLGAIGIELYRGISVDAARRGLWQSRAG